MLRSFVSAFRVSYPRIRSTFKFNSSSSQIVSRRTFFQGQQNGWKQSTVNQNFASPSPSIPLIVTALLGTSACGLFYLAQAEENKVMKSPEDSAKWVQNFQNPPDYSVGPAAIRLLMRISEEERVRLGVPLATLIGFISYIPNDILNFWIAALKNDENVDAYNLVAALLPYKSGITEQANLLEQKVSKIYNVSLKNDTDDIPSKSEEDSRIRFAKEILQGVYFAAKDPDAMIAKFIYIEEQYINSEDNEKKRQLINEMSDSIKSAGGLGIVKSWFIDASKSEMQAHFPLLTGEFLLKK